MVAGSATSRAGPSCGGRRPSRSSSHRAGRHAGSLRRPRPWRTERSPIPRAITTMTASDIDQPRRRRARSNRGATACTRPPARVWSPTRLRRHIECWPSRRAVSRSAGSVESFHQPACRPRWSPAGDKRQTRSVTRARWATTGRRRIGSLPVGARAARARDNSADRICGPRCALTVVDSSIDEVSPYQPRTSRPIGSIQAGLHGLIGGTSTSHRWRKPTPSAHQRSCPIDNALMVYAGPGTCDRINPDIGSRSSVGRPGYYDHGPMAPRTVTHRS